MADTETADRKTADRKTADRQTGRRPNGISSFSPPPQSITFNLATRLRGIMNFFINAIIVTFYHHRYGAWLTDAGRCRLISTSLFFSLPQLTDGWLIERQLTDRQVEDPMESHRSH